MLRHVGILRLAAALFLATSAASAQEPDARTRAWVSAGIGPGGASDGAGGMAGIIQLSGLRAPHQLTIRLAGATPVFYHGATADEISLLYSRALRGRSGHLSVGTGAGVTSRDPCNGSGPECDADRRVAVAFAAEGMLRILPVFGLGVHVFANLSEFGYMGGCAVVAQVGWLPR